MLTLLAVKGHQESWWPNPSTCWQSDLGDGLKLGPWAQLHCSHVCA